MKKISLFLTALLFAGFVHSQETVSDFENLTLITDSLWNGSDGSGGFNSGNAHFINSYDTSFGGIWNGFGYTNIVDTTTAGSNTAIAGKGYGGSSNYAVANLYGNARISITGAGANKIVSGFYISNCTYTAISMRDGDFFGKKFGGSTGNDEDWLKLTVKGFTNGVFKANTVEFYLADYRFADNSQDYMVNDWQWLDLTPLGNVDSIQFFLSSSDTGQYGMNTPAYFVLDNFTTTQIVNVPPVANDELVTLSYITDSLIQVVNNDFDTTSGPLTAHVIYGPIIPGASAKDSAHGIFYHPAVGVVAVDTIVYAVCDEANLCDTATLFVNVVSATGINDIVQLNASISPNPFSSSFVISGTIDAVALFDIQGKQLMDIRSVSYGNRTEINADALPQGLYFVKLGTGGKTAVAKLIKQ